MRDSGRVEAAIPVYRRVTALALAELDNDDSQAALCFVDFGRALLLTDEVKEGLLNLRSGAEDLDRILGGNDALTRDAFIDLAEAYRSHRMEEEAELIERKLNR